MEASGDSSATNSSLDAPMGVAGLARVPAQAGTPSHCRSCGALAPVGRIRVVGAWSIEQERAVWDCEVCARANLEAIEAGVFRR